MLRDLTVNLDKLDRYSFSEMQTECVTEVVLALGSNHQADYHLAQTRESLAEFGDLTLSTPFKNPDFTATSLQPKPDYTNQCVHLVLTKSVMLHELQQSFKTIETACGRDRLGERLASIKLVTMDIDILLVHLKIKKNSLSRISTKEWLAIKERYPFKAHERIGVEELRVISFL